MFELPLDRFKNRSFKISSSCKEDVDLERRDGGCSVDGLAFLEHGDPRSFAKDLIYRSKESCHNPDHSLSILTYGRRKIKEYSDGHDEQRATRDFHHLMEDKSFNDVSQQNMASCTSKKQPEEHSFEEYVHKTQNTEHLCHGKSDQSQSGMANNSSKCNGCNTSTTQVSSKSDGSSLHCGGSKRRVSGATGGDDDDDDDSKKRNRTLKKSYEFTCVTEEEEEDTKLKELNIVKKETKETQQEIEVARTDTGNSACSENKLKFNPLFADKTDLKELEVSLTAAFKCKSEKLGVFGRCEELVCYNLHLLLYHNKDCKKRVFGGCVDCIHLRDVYIYHAMRCISDTCVVSRCFETKQYLKTSTDLCLDKWSYEDDIALFGPRAHTDQNILANLPQGCSQQQITNDEILEYIKVIQNKSLKCHDLESCTSNQIDETLACVEGQETYHPIRPPDNRCITARGISFQAQTPDQSYYFPRSVDQAVVNTNENVGTKSVAKEEEVANQTTNKSCVSINGQREPSIGHHQETRPKPRPDDVLFLHPLDEAKLGVRNGRYDEGHEWRKVQQDSFLGQGAFGKCYLCTDLTNNKLFAIKKVPVNKYDPNELTIWASISGQTIKCLDLHGAVRVNQSVIIYMEYMEGGSVNDIISCLEDNRLDENSALYILREILESLDFLHSKRIIHRDIKADNVLVNSTLTSVKLGDYGAAILLDAMEYTQDSSPPGTEFYMAPEVCRSEQHSFSADIWSAACVLVFMLTGNPPWIEFASGSVLYKVGTTKTPPTFPDCSPSTRNLLTKMFALDPKLRPTAKALLSHCAFNAVNGPPTLPILFQGDDDGDDDDGDDDDSENSEDDSNFSPEKVCSSKVNNDAMEPPSGTTRQSAYAGPDYEQSFCGKAFLVTSSPADEDDELRQLRSDLLQRVSLGGGDVSDCVVVTDISITKEEDVFEEKDYDSLYAASEEHCSPGRFYSMKDLTKVEMYGGSGELLFTVREKACCTFGELAKKLQNTVREKDVNLTNFTLQFIDGSAVDRNQLLGSTNHKIRVLPTE